MLSTHWLGSEASTSPMVATNLQKSRGSIYIIHQHTMDSQQITPPEHLKLHDTKYPIMQVALNLLYKARKAIKIFSTPTNKSKLGHDL